MEHRWSIRKPMQAPITLALPTWEKLQTTICDVSLGGLSVLRPQRTIPANSLVKLSFSLDQGDHISCYRLLAQVVYSDESRVGLLFLEPGRETLQALREMLYSPARKLPTMLSGHTNAA